LEDSESVSYIFLISKKPKFGVFSINALRGVWISTTTPSITGFNGPVSGPPPILVSDYHNWSDFVNLLSASYVAHSGYFDIFSTNN